MKNLVLNNYNQFDQDERFAKFLETHFTENQEKWNHFQEAFWKENKEKTLERFSSLESGDNILCHTVFDGWQQLELMLFLLHGYISKNIKLNIYISHRELIQTFNDFFNEYESSICPDTKEYDESPALRKKFKKDVNAKMLEVLEYHNVHELHERYFDREPPTPIRSIDIIEE